jgi:hypothetical protein
MEVQSSLTQIDDRQSAADEIVAQVFGNKQWFFLLTAIYYLFKSNISQQKEEHE